MALLAAKNCSNSRECEYGQTDRQTDRVNMLCHFRRLGRQPEIAAVVSTNYRKSLTGSDFGSVLAAGWLAVSVSCDAWSIVIKSLSIAVGSSRSFSWPSPARVGSSRAGGGFSLVEVSEPPEEEEILAERYGRATRSNETGIICQRFLGSRFKHVNSTSRIIMIKLCQSIVSNFGCLRSFKLIS